MIKALILALVTAGPAAAQQVTDLDWPCVQRKQPQLSIAQVWTGPLPDDATEAKANDATIRTLARNIALRRTSLEDAEAMIDTFAGDHDPADMTALFLATFNDVQRARDRVMAGITRYAHSQETLDARINTLRKDFDALNAADPPDFDAIDKMEADLDWATRIFKDRQQALSYVCETPVILEQRAFALGRLIQGKL